MFVKIIKNIPKGGMMIFDDFEIHASPFMTNAYCKVCRGSLVEVSNGWFSSAMFCPKCKIAYTVKLIKVPDKQVSKEFLEQAEKEANKKQHTKEE